MPHLLVFGARNLGRVIGEHFLAQGWEATGVARSQETADAFPGTGIVADATSAESMRGVVEQAAPFDLVVNAVSPKGRFGGGDLVTTDDDAMAPYLEQVLPTAFAFFRICGGALIERGGGTIVQVTGGSARRALPGGRRGAPAPPASARSHRRRRTSSSRTASTPRSWCATGRSAARATTRAASGSTPASWRRPSSSCTSRGGERGRTSSS